MEAITVTPEKIQPPVIAGLDPEQGHEELRSNGNDDEVAALAIETINVDTTSVTGVENQGTIDKKKPKLSPEERKLFQHSAEGDLKARNRLVEIYLPLAHYFASKFAIPKSRQFDDLVQTACIGLIKSVDGFDINRGVVFGTYATPKIKGEIKRYFRENASGIRVPRPLHDSIMAVNKAINDLERNQQKVTVKDVASKIGITAEEASEAMEARACVGPNIMSLDQPLDSENSDMPAFGDAVADPLAEERMIAGLDYNDFLARIASLHPKTCSIVEARLEGLTQAEIAERVKLSQMHVSRLLRKVREELTEETAV